MSADLIIKKRGIYEWGRSNKRKKGLLLNELENMNNFSYLPYMSIE